jgi:hypothetical protein
VGGSVSSGEVEDVDIEDLGLNEKALIVYGSRNYFERRRKSRISNGNPSCCFSKFALSSFTSS